MSEKGDSQEKSTDSKPEKPTDSKPASNDFAGEQTKARKVVQGFTQALIQWMPLGGSGTAFVSFVLKSEWLQALLMFPVMAVTVVWAAYTEAVLTRLREISAERGKKDVDDFMAWLKGVDEAIRWQLAGVEDKYLRCQGSACREYRTEGYNRGTFVPLLSEVFVPLELSSAFVKGVSGEELPMFPGFRQEDVELIRAVAENELLIWDLLGKIKQYPAFSRMAILAWGGYGKTTLLRHITYTYAKHRHRRYRVPQFLPVLLPLRKWQSVIATEENLDLPSLIEKHHIPSLPSGADLKLPPQWAKNQLQGGKMLVMFDGFDEVKPEWRKRVSTWLGKQMGDYQKSVFILTSRPGGYKDYAATNSPSSKLYVKSFNAEQRQRFIEKWYLTQERYARAGRNTPEVKQIANSNVANLLQQLQQRPELEVLAKNPLLLNMIANLHRSYAGQQLPQRRNELYQDILTLQLKDRPRSRGIDMLVPFPESQQILQKVALTMVESKQPSINRWELETWIDNHLQNLDFGKTVAVSEFLNQIVDVSELIVKRDEDLEFAHLSFQGYLAAAEIKARKQEQLLLEHCQYSWWKETILLYCGQVNPSNLIRAFLNIGEQSAIDLAHECLKESPRKIDLEIEAELQQLEQSVSNLLYQQLENYLKNGKWEEANRETYRLMIQTVGKEKGQFLEREDYENFPCEDLRTINQLWMSNSQGKFGFSVQKEIYESLGGTEKYNGEVWKNWCKYVGWSDGVVNFSYEAPKAHLPITLPVSPEKREYYFHLPTSHRGGHGRVSSLAQRLVTCNI
ncbi:MAG: GUN4 domain-containing protein [Calothrix sp. MO_167.B12]|nr:GUN4 domain-containing protein [Calothrix sp. MO_167.B12]